eukprot:scaffold4428_cov57-Cyclotella_meneghiniana.AAC.7
MNELHENDMIDTTNLIKFSEYEALMATTATADKEEEASTEEAEETVEARSKVEEGEDENAVVKSKSKWSQTDVTMIRTNYRRMLPRTTGIEGAQRRTVPFNQQSPNVTIVQMQSRGCQSSGRSKDYYSPSCEVFAKGLYC